MCVKKKAREAADAGLLKQRYLWQEIPKRYWRANSKL